VSGEISHSLYQEKALSVHEKRLGSVLFCCATPNSDLTIEVNNAAANTRFPQVDRMLTRVIKVHKVVDNVVILTLQLPTEKRLEYFAGQYVEFVLPNGRRRSYSIANAPHINDYLSFHIQWVPGGLFTEQVFTSSMKERDILRIEGPFGRFFLREESEKPMVLLASGTGFSPIKAIIERYIYKGYRRPIRLYWGGKNLKDLYMARLCEEWENTLPNFDFIPVLSATKDKWQGRTGFVHQAVVADLPDLSNHQVYACGSPAMVDAAKCDFVNICKLPDEEFYADSFISRMD
jgi:CDP-4-dehydro-6-deoxyglucose reductase